jgi:thiopeptide-type bacteriocin biosynthesis protein
MPPDQLDPTHSTLEKTERAIHDVLVGVPLQDAAACADLEPTELAAAVEIYRQAGRHALHHQITAGWWQLYLQFTDWRSAEKIAADHLAPPLERAETDSTITGWWFIRKHPCWRLRLHTRPDSSVKASLGTALDELASLGTIERWWTGIYEPETAAFGGPASMTCAHQLFHADSRAILLDLPRHTSPLGRRELSLLLCTILLRAAGLEWYEAGDVWHRVAAERPLPADIPPDRPHAMANDLRQLLLADTTPEGPMLAPGGPAAFAAHWADAFRHAGTSLGTAARAGTLNRGLRHILAYHIIFHWNRIGLPRRTQSILAAAASTAILDPSEERART